MASIITTLLFTMLIINVIEMRQQSQSKKEKEGLWVVRQVVPLPAEEVVIYIDPEEEMVVDQEKEEEVVFVAKTSKRERKKTATLPIVIGVVGGVVFVLLSLLTILCIRPIRWENYRFSHNCKISALKNNISVQEAR